MRLSHTVRRMSIGKFKLFYYGQLYCFPWNIGTAKKPGIRALDNGVSQWDKRTSKPMQQAPAMPYQATRQSQAGTAEKPGVWLSCSSALALKLVSQSQRDRYQDLSHGDSPAHSRPAHQIESRTAGEQATGKGRRSAPISCARINPAGERRRALSEGIQGRDPATAHYLISYRTAACTKYLIHNDTGMVKRLFNILVIMRNALDYAHTINHLQIEPGIMGRYALQQLRRNKGAPVPSVEHGHRHQVRHGMHPVRMASVSGMPYISTAYDAARCSAQRAGTAGAQANRRTPGGQVKFPFPSTGRRTGGAPHA